MTSYGTQSEHEHESCDKEIALLKSRLTASEQAKEKAEVERDNVQGELASLADLINTELRENHARKQAELGQDLKPFILLLVDTMRAKQKDLEAQLAAARDGLLCGESLAEDLMMECSAEAEEGARKKLAIIRKALSLPPAGESGEEKKGLYPCPCGENLYTVEEKLEHESRGHFRTREDRYRKALSTALVYVERAVKSNNCQHGPNDQCDMICVENAQIAQDVMFIRSLLERPEGEESRCIRCEAGVCSEHQIPVSWCGWRRLDGDGPWHTGCGEAFEFNGEGPKENGFKFCYSCGKPLVIQEPPASGEGRQDG